MAKSQELDYGATFRLTFKDQAGAVVDISEATTKQIHFMKPDETTTMAKAGEFTTDGTNGQLEYVSVAADLDKDGSWQIQGYIKDAASQYKSSIHRFTVKDNLVAYV